MPVFVLRLAVLSAASLLLSSTVQAAPRPAAPGFFPTGGVADAPSGFVDMCARDRSLCLAGHADAAPPAATIAAAEPHDQVAIAAIATFSPMGMTVAAPCGPGTADTGCAAPAASPAPVAAFTPAVLTTASADVAPDMAFLRRINGKVNRTVFQAYDMDTVGVPDRWQRPDPNRRLMGDCEDIAIEKRARLLAAGVAPDRMFFAVAYLPGIGLHAVLIARLDDGDYVLDSRTTKILPWSEVHYNWLRIQSASDPMVWNRFGIPQRSPEVARSAGGAAAS
jgi:predicted transglutaminase-like cysteine proteinase